MDSLKNLNDKIREELHLKEEDYSNDMMDDEIMDGEMSDEELEMEAEAEADEQSSRESKARIRVETESKIRGIIKNLDFEVNFRDLADRINDEIDGVVLTREKSHQLFNIVRDFLGF